MQRSIRKMMKAGAGPTCEVQIRHRTSAGDNAAGKYLVSQAPSDEWITSDPIKCFVYTVSDGQVTSRGFQIIATGDHIFDFESNQEIPPGAQIVFNGKIYVQKDGGAEIEEFFGSFVENQPVFRSVLARREVIKP